MLSTDLMVVPNSLFIGFCPWVNKPEEVPFVYPADKFDPFAPATDVMRVSFCRKQPRAAVVFWELVIAVRIELREVLP